MLRVGTSGYGYHTWSPSFYPPGLPYADYAAHYARELGFCELNETFFELPAPTWADELLGGLPSPFLVSVKLFRRLTHERSGELVLARRFADRLAPLVEEGRLVAVVAQFPFGFVNNPENRAYLCRLRAAIELPMVVELRNPSWHRAETSSFLKGWGIGLVVFDAPEGAGLPGPWSVGTSPVGYVRLHGRRAARWWRTERDPSRYDYRYSRRELLGWLPRIRQLARETERVFVVFNQHGSLHALANVRALEKLLARAGARRRVDEPTSRDAARVG